MARKPSGALRRGWTTGACATAAADAVSETAVRAFHNPPEFAPIDMGDFVGELLKYLRNHPIPRLTFAGVSAKHPPRYARKRTYRFYRS